MVTNNATNTATGASGTILRGAGVGTAPTFSTATYPATAGTTGNVLTSNGTNWSSSAVSGGGTVTTQATTSGTTYTISVSTSSKLIVVTLIGLSGNGTNQLLCQLGTGSGFETSGYVGNTNDLIASSNWSTSIIVTNTNLAANLYNGNIELTCTDTTNNVWGVKGYVGDSGGAPNQQYSSIGNKPLAAAITQLKLFWSGVNSFDAGSFGVLVYT